MIGQQGKTQPLLTVKEAARQLHLDERTIRRAILKGQLQTVEISERRYIHRAALERLIEAA